MTYARINLTGDYGLAAQGVCFDPITATLAAIGGGSAMAGLGTAATIAGGAVSALGQINAGQQAKASAQSQALQMDQQATQERAAGQRRMFERQRETDLTQSKLQANAAASGGDATDPTVLNLGGAIAGRGEQMALTDLYNGENSARGLEDKATATRLSGDAAEKGAYYSAAGTLFGSIGNGFGKYLNTGSNSPKPQKAVEY